MANKKKEQEQARAAFENGQAALKQNDLDKAVWDFFKATRLDFGEKEYHQAFADALRKRGLKPMEEKDAARAEKLYQDALKCRELSRLDMKLEAALLGHIDAAFELRREFVISVWTSAEGKVLTDLLLDVNCPQALCAVAVNYEYGVDGYPKDKKKAMELLMIAAAQGYEPAIQTIENIKRCEKEEKERKKAEEEFAKNNPPLKGEEKKKAEDELIGLLHQLKRKATFIKVEECRAPKPLKQILTSHVGGYPYFEKGGEWPCDNESNLPYEFIFQVFQHDDNSIILPDGVKLLQVFYDWDNELEHIVFYFELQKDKAIIIKNPLDRNLKYKVVIPETVDMYPEFDYIFAADRKAAALADKIHPGESWSVFDRIYSKFNFCQPLLDSYLGGYFGEFVDYQTDKVPYKNNVPLFQLYLDSDGECPFGWKSWYDALLYSTYNIKTSEADSYLRVNYD